MNLDETGQLGHVLSYYIIICLFQIPPFLLTAHLAVAIHVQRAVGMHRKLEISANAVYFHLYQRCDWLTWLFI